MHFLVGFTNRTDLSSKFVCVTSESAKLDFLKSGIGKTLEQVLAALHLLFFKNCFHELVHIKLDIFILVDFLFSRMSFEHKLADLICFTRWKFNIFEICA